MDISLEITGLKGVGDMSLKLQPNKRAYVLFGRNGSGKTQLLKALLLYWLEYHRDKTSPSFQTRGGEGLLFEAAVGCVGTVSGSTLDIGFPSATYEMTTDSQAVLQQSTLSGVFLLDAKSRIDLIETGIEERVIGTLAQRAARARSESHLQLNLSPVITGVLEMQTTARWFVSRAQASNPFQSDADQRGNDVLAVLDMMHRVDPRFGAAIADLRINSDESVSLRVDGELRRLQELSSGFLALVRLLQGIVDRLGSFSSCADLCEVSALILIDEIESHLHVEWQVQIVGKLKDLFPNCIFVIATHSPLVLAQVEDGEAYVLERGHGGVVCAQPIARPARRMMVDVLRDATGVDLDETKLAFSDRDSQADLKSALRMMLPAAPTQ